MIHRISLTSAWKAFRQNRDAVLWRRVFHCPSGLGDHTRVWLVLEGEPQLQILRLNGRLLFQETHGGIDRNNVQRRFDIRNQLTAGENILDLVLLMGEQPSEEFCPQACRSRLRPIPVEVYLEIQEVDTAE